jgi:hypothetical protein
LLRLARDPAMRWVVGGRAVHDCAASASQMGRFETERLASEENLAALADLSGRWIDRVHGRQPPRTIILDMDSSVSPTYGDQEGTAYNGHFACTCYHPLFVFNQFGDLERCVLRPDRRRAFFLAGISKLTRFVQAWAAATCQIHIMSKAGRNSAEI